MLEFLHSHSSVVFQPDFDDPRFSGLNPYALGFAMMSRHPAASARSRPRRTASGSRTSPAAATRYGVLRHAWANYRDESFILQYLSPAVIRKFRLFQSPTTAASRRCGSRRSTTSSAIARSAARCREQYDLSRREPDIQVVDVDLTGDRCLMLAHYVHDGVLLDEKTCRSVLRYVAVLWGYSVKLLEIEAATDKTLKTYEVAPAELSAAAAPARWDRRPAPAGGRSDDRPRHRDQLRRDRRGGRRRRAAGPQIRANLIRSQLAEHAPYGGVVPEIAARAHLDHLDGLVRRALAEAGIGFDELDGVAAAAGPGLIGGLIVGTMAAKGIAWAARQAVPRGQSSRSACADRAARPTASRFPICCCWSPAATRSCSSAPGSDDYRQLGTSRDDAAGEAFDKTAKLLGLGYPGGPAIERAARDGDPRRFALPRPLKGRAGLRFLVFRAEDGGAADRGRHGRAAGPIGRRMSPISPPRSRRRSATRWSTAPRNAIAWFRRSYPAGQDLVAAGGVAANRRLRARALPSSRRRAGLDFVAPPPALCTDNGAMIAWAGLERLRLGLIDGLDAPVRPRWPLDAEARPRPDGVGLIVGRGVRHGMPPQPEGGRR